MQEPAETKRCYECPRIYTRLRREGWRVNHKKIERLYREEGLPLRRWARKKLTAVPRVALPLPREPGRCSRWTLSMAGWPLADGSSA
jgi:putative transposase